MCGFMMTWQPLLLLALLLLLLAHLSWRARARGTSRPSRCCCCCCCWRRPLAACQLPFLLPGCLCRLLHLVRCRLAVLLLLLSA
jgi:hypothetical protein